MTIPQSRQVANAKFERSCRIISRNSAYLLFIIQLIMEAKLNESIEAIKRARDYNKETNYAFARNQYIKGLGLLHQVYTNEINPAKKELLKKKMDGYLAEAQINKQNFEKKQIAMTVPWNVFPSKQFEKARISKVQSKEQPKVQIKDQKMEPRQPTKLVVTPKEPIIEQKITSINYTQPIRQTKQVIPPPPPPARRPETRLPKQARISKKVEQDIQQFILEDTHISFDDIANMTDIKRILQQTIILPRLRPDLFQGIRQPPRGILLYGPPGNGKTFLAKALATQSGCTFFNLSASSMVSKYMGDAQKMLRKIFSAAYDTAPSIIFIDQIDSILTSRKQSEQDSSRRLKTEFLTQMEGISTTDSDSVVVIGATNMPQELDKAALRRFAKKIYIGLPGLEARMQMVDRVVSQVTNNISKSDLEEIGKKLDNYSASDITSVAAEACQIPVREVEKEVKTIDAKKIRPVNKRDFLQTIKNVPPNLTRSEVFQFKLL